jgi:hypothetical protein
MRTIGTKGTTGYRRMKERREREREKERNTFKKSEQENGDKNRL